MKILVLASTIDLKYRLGCTPAWWQLLKAFHESGHEVVLIPYLGDAIESPWWRTHPNPLATESKLFNRFGRPRPKEASDGRALGLPWHQRFLVRRWVRPRWLAHLRRVLRREKNVAFIFAMNVPINHLDAVFAQIRSEFNVPIAYYDGDMPTILPEHAGRRQFKFSYYVGADLSPFDAFFTNSEGVIPQLSRMGAKRVAPLHYAADPSYLRPAQVAKQVDVAFFGYGDQLREEWMARMIADPSAALDASFVVGGGGFRVGLGRAQAVGDVPYAEFAAFVGRARINLNITRTSHTTVHASSTMRPFELAALGACVVSQPYDGLEKWFRPGREIEIVKDASDVVPLYRSLLADDARRQGMAAAARQRILDSHTYQHRVSEVLAHLKVAA